MGLPQAAAGVDSTARPEEVKAGASAAALGAAVGAGGPARAVALLRRGGEAVRLPLAADSPVGRRRRSPRPSAWPASPRRRASWRFQYSSGLEEGVTPTPDRPCGPFPRGPVTGGAGTPARPLRPPPRGWPGGDQPETEEAGEAGWGSCCRQTGARHPTSCVSSPHGRRGWSWGGGGDGGPSCHDPLLPPHQLVPTWLGELGGPWAGPGCGGVRVCPRCPDPSA